MIAKSPLAIGDTRAGDGTPSSTLVRAMCDRRRSGDDAVLPIIRPFTQIPGLNSRRTLRKNFGRLGTLMRVNPVSFSPESDRPTTMYEPGATPSPITNAPDAALLCPW